MSDADLEDLYQAIILDHYKSPRCQGDCKNPAASSSQFNPLCGDKIDLQISGAQAKIEDIRFKAKGCAISQASASLMAELCTNKSTSDIIKLHELFKQMLIGIEMIDAQKISILGDMTAFASLRKFPARYRCAFLGWEALLECLKKL